MKELEMLWDSFAEIMLGIFAIIGMIVMFGGMLALAIGPIVWALIEMNGWYLFILIPSWTLLSYVIKKLNE